MPLIWNFLYQTLHTPNGLLSVQNAIVNESPTALNSISGACGQAIVTVLQLLIVYDSLLFLQTLVFERLKAHPFSLGHYSCLLSPDQKLTPALSQNDKNSLLRFGPSRPKESCRRPHASPYWDPQAASGGSRLAKETHFGPDSIRQGALCQPAGPDRPLCWARLLFTS